MKRTSKDEYSKVDVDEHPEQHEDVPCRTGDAAAEQGGDPAATDTPVNPASDVAPSLQAY